MYLEKRLWEIDFLRGTAVVLMIFHHFAYDLSYFRGINLFEGDLFWFVFPRIIAGTFILLAGVSLSLSHMKNPCRKFTNYFWRGAGIFFLGAVITLVTCILVPQIYIIFGILHFIGVSTMLAYPFLKQGKKNLLYAAAIIIAGLLLSQHEYNFSHLLWLGFSPAGFRTLDYFPLLPWFGLILVGIYLGQGLYKNYKRKISLPELGEKPVIDYVCFLGRKSLLIYFLHQPLIFAGMYLAGFI